MTQAEKDKIVRAALDVVGRVTGVDPVTLQSRSRKAPIFRARMLFCWLCAGEGMSYTAIGRAIHITHATVTHCVSTMADFNWHLARHFPEERAIYQRAEEEFNNLMKQHDT